MDINRFWEAVLKQDRRRLADFFWPDAVIRWPCTNEQFTVPEFVQANCEYPGKWDGEIERADQYGNRIITAVRVYPADRSSSYHVVSFFSLKDGRITALDEHWADDGDAPAWRKSMGVGKPIRS